MIVNDIAHAIPELRAQAESLMVDTCRIDRVIGVTSDDRGDEVIQLKDPPIYVGPCKVRTFNPYEQDREVTTGTVTSQRYSLHIPVTAVGIKVGDYATLTDGRVFRVAATHVITWQTAQRLYVDEQTGGITV